MEILRTIGNMEGVQIRIKSQIPETMSEVLLSFKEKDICMYKNHKFCAFLILMTWSSKGNRESWEFVGRKKNQIIRSPSVRRRGQNDPGHSGKVGRLINSFLDARQESSLSQNPFVKTVQSRLQTTQAKLA